MKILPLLMTLITDTIINTYKENNNKQKKENRTEIIKNSINEVFNELMNEIDTIKIENKRHKDKYDDIYKRLKRTYDNTYKRYDDQRKFLMIEIDQLKNRKLKYASKLRILDRLKNPDKYDNNVIDMNKSNNNEKNNEKNNDNNNE